MESKEFVEFCHEIDIGSKRLVKNRVRQEEGMAIACNKRRIEVEVAGQRKSWPMEDCEFLESGG